jgi:hypothetical protein
MLTLFRGGPTVWVSVEDAAGWAAGRGMGGCGIATA